MESVCITIVIDNFTSSLLANNAPVTRLATNKEIQSNITEGIAVKDRLRAEHGFSAWITIDTGNRKHNLIFDAGVSPTGASENLEKLEINPKDAEMIVLSHGHHDHTMGLDGFLKTLGRKRTKLQSHDSFNAS